MSWTSDKTGRPKEEGGHHRIDISVDGRILRILDAPNNRSEYVEHCVDACTVTHWIAFQEYSVTVNDDYRTTKTGGAFVWVPYDCANNAIVSTYCTFKYQCEGKGFRFRLRINGADTSFIQVGGQQDWSFSQVYTNWSFADGIKALPNQNSYTIEFQIEPEGASDRVHVGNICMFLEVVDGLPTLRV